MLTACTAPGETRVDTRADTRFLDHLLDTDDARHCDAVGWAMITHEFARPRRMSQPYPGGGHPDDDA